MVALKQLRQNVAATIIPRSERQMRRTSRNNLESWKRRIHREMAIRIDFHAGRMVDSEEANLIEIERSSSSGSTRRNSSRPFLNRTSEPLTLRYSSAF